MCPSCIILGVILMVFGVSLTMTQVALVSVPCIISSILLFMWIAKKMKKKCKPGKCEL